MMDPIAPEVTEPQSARILNAAPSVAVRLRPIDISWAVSKIPTPPQHPLTGLHKLIEQVGN